MRSEARRVWSAFRWKLLLGLLIPVAAFLYYRPPNAWLVARVCSENRDTARAATQILSVRGAGCAPALARQLRSARQQQRRWGIPPGGIPEIIMLASQYQSDSEYLKNTLEELQLHRCEEIRSWASRALADGPAFWQDSPIPEGVESVSIAEWIEELNHRDLNVRRWAAYRLSQQQGYIAEAVEPLLEALHAKDLNLKANAARALGATARSDGQTLPGLIEALNKLSLPAGVDIKIKASARHSES